MKAFDSQETILILEINMVDTGNTILYNQQQWDRLIPDTRFCWIIEKYFEKLPCIFMMSNVKIAALKLANLVS